MTKQEARECATHGYRYAGFWDDMYHFSKYIPTKYVSIDDKTQKREEGGCLNIKISQDRLLNGEYKEMMKHNITQL